MNGYIKPLLAVAAVVVIAVAGIGYRRTTTRRCRRWPRFAGPVRHRRVASASPSTSPSPIASAHAIHLRPIGGRRVSGVVHGARRRSRRSCPQAVKRPGASWPARRSPSRRAGSTSPITPTIYVLFPDTPANKAEYALSKGTAHNIILAEHGREQHVRHLRSNRAFSGRNGGRGDRRPGGQRQALHDRAGRRDDRWPPRPTGRRPAQPRLERRLARLGRTTPRRGTTRTPAIASSCSTPRMAVPSGSPSARRTRPDFEAFLAEAMPILESFQFDLPPAALPVAVLSPSGAGASPCRGSRASGYSASIAPASVASSRSVRAPGFRASTGSAPAHDPQAVTGEDDPDEDDHEAVDRMERGDGRVRRPHRDEDRLEAEHHDEGHGQSELSTRQAPHQGQGEHHQEQVTEVCIPRSDGP